MTQNKAISWLPAWTKPANHLQTRSYVLLGVFLFIICFTALAYPRFDEGTVTFLHRQPTPSPRDAAANSTLGFQQLLALSIRPGWRTRGLRAAADLTGLEFKVPPQPQNPEKLVHAFRNIGKGEGAVVPEYGSARAWLAHLDLLKFVVASGLETAFIVEDDVDWDIRVKNQMRLISDNVRNYTDTLEDDTTPYGDDWDILWLGHCGSTIEDGMPDPLLFPDDSRCETELYSGWSRPFLRDRLPEGYRQVQFSFQTVCTFGYGVTRRSAQKVLSLAAEGGFEAFDVSLSAHCRSGKLRCLVVNPQVFNHYEPPADQGYISPVHVGDGQGDRGDESRFEGLKGTTGNIMKSARCEALFNDVCMRPPSDI